jgi:hypothetical protein
MTPEPPSQKAAKDTDVFAVAMTTASPHLRPFAEGPSGTILKSRE